MNLVPIPGLLSVVPNDRVLFRIDPRRMKLWG